MGGHAHPTYLSEYTHTQICQRVLHELKISVYFFVGGGEQMGQVCIYIYQENQLELCDPEEYVFSMRYEQPWI